MRARIVATALFLLAALPAAAEPEKWLHLRVQEENGRQTRVEVNLPYSVFAVVVPLLPDLEPDECDIWIHGDRLTAAELRELVRAVEKSPDLKPSSIEHEDGALTAFRRGETLVIQTTERYFSDERSEVQLPLRVVQALVQRGGDLFDLRAAALELVRIGEGELLFAADDDSIVRVWVDRVPAGARRRR